MKIRAIIVDDEFLARERLKKLLEKSLVINIIGECKNGNEAVALIKKMKPDLIFLDIQMPDISGFEVLKKLRTDNLPLIVFTTAYDQYAIDAFEIHAIDYLLKPFDEERLKKAIDEVTKQYELQNSASIQHKLKDLLKDIERKESDFRDVFEIKEKGVAFEIKAENITYIESDGNYIKLHSGKKKYLYRQTISNLEEVLNPSLFLRIHRGFMVNINFVESSSYLTNKEFLFQLEGGVEIISGRTYYNSIASHFKK